MAAEMALERAPARREHGSVAWMGFVATLENQLKAFYREPAALAFTLGQPLILLLILNAFNFHVTLPNGETRPYLDRLLPGMIAFNGMIVGLNSLLFPLARYKQRGILRRVRATPLPTSSFVAGVIVSRLIVGLLVTLITYLSGVLLFGATVHGNVPLILALSVLGSGVFIALGLLIVSFAKSEDDIPPLFMLVLMPSLLFSGAFLERGGLPDWLRIITNGLPLTFLTNAVQEIANLGGSVGDISTDLLGLAIWGACATVLAAWRFRMT